LFVCKIYISLTWLNGFFALFNFDNIYIKSYISIWSLFLHANNSKKTKQLLGFQKTRKKIRQNKNAWFSWKRLCIGWGRQQKTNEKPGRKPRYQKTKCFGWIYAPKKGLCITSQEMRGEQKKISKNKIWKLLAQQIRAVWLIIY
jgi:hypothetical protein